MTVLEVSPGWRHLCITPANIVQVIAPVPAAAAADPAPEASPLALPIQQHDPPRVKPALPLRSESQPLPRVGMTRPSYGGLSHGPHGAPTRQGDLRHTEPPLRASLGNASNYSGNVSKHSEAIAGVDRKAGGTQAGGAPAAAVAVQGGSNGPGSELGGGKTRAKSVALLLEGDDEQDAELADMMDEMDRQMDP